MLVYDFGDLRWAPGGGSSLPSRGDGDGGEVIPGLRRRLARGRPDVSRSEPTSTIEPVRSGPRRREFIEKAFDISSLDVLEIGAFDHPTYNRGEVQIAFFDRFDPGELSEKYSHVETRDTDATVVPDYVSKEKRFSAVVDRSFDLVIANHVLEHVADPLTWLAEVAAVTGPNGHLFMALPDRRYTFDILRRDSTLSDWIRWREDDLEKASADQLFDAIYYHRAITHMDVWRGNMNAKLEIKRFPADEAWRRAQVHAAEPAPDVHCSVFSSVSFRELWCNVEELGIPWRWDQFEDVVPGSNEFFVLLARV